MSDWGDKTAASAARCLGAQGIDFPKPGKCERMKES